MKHYKVVLQLDGRLTSSWALWCNVEYKPNEWARPKFGKLFVFDNLEAAKKHVAQLDRLNIRRALIFECVVWKPTVQERIANYEMDYYNFWKKPGTVETMQALAGTVFVDAVKLIREILYDVL